MFQAVFVIALLSRFGILFYLSWRQERCVISHRDTVPQDFAQQLSLEQHQKAADYTVAKQRFTRLALAVEAAVLTLWLLAGGLGWLDAWVQQLLGHFVWWHGIVVIGVFSVINSILDLPMTLYQTFVLEERFGFNRTSVKTFLTDMLKGLLLGTVLGGGVLGVILWLMHIFATGLWWLWVSLFIVLFQLTMVVVYPRYLAPIFNTFTVLDDATVRDKVESLLQRCGFSAQAVYVMDGSKRSSHGNAYFTGLGKHKRVVFFDTLMEQLTPNQIEAVLAHELGHYALGHIPKLLLVNALKIVVGLGVLAVLLEAPWFFSNFGVEMSHHMALLLFMLVLPIFTAFLSPLFNILSRKHEFEADRYAAEYSEADELINALLALYRDNAVTLTPDVLYSAWHDSHPPAAQRIAALRVI